MERRSEGKVAIGTGGASGIARVGSGRLCREGAGVTFSGLRDVGEKTGAEFTEAG